MKTNKEWAGEFGDDLKEVKSYRNNKQKAYKEGFDEFRQYSNTVILDDEIYHLHDNINLYLDITPNCSCNCEFCIAKTTYNRVKINNLEYLYKFEKAINFLLKKGINFSIQVTGGEPTIDDKLGDIIKIIDKYKLKRPVLNTNGQNLYKYIDIINNSTFEHINISRHHYNDTQNQLIMGNAISSKKLSEVTKNIEKDIRLQCNMIGDYIDTYGEVMQFIAYAYYKLNVENISFAILTPLPKDDIYKQDIISFVEQHNLDADKILEQVETDSRFNFIKHRGGVACYYEIWNFMAYENTIMVLFKYSDNMWLKKADMLKTYYPDLIFHTDAVLCGSWNKNIKIINYEG